MNGRVRDPADVAREGEELAKWLDAEADNDRMTPDALKLERAAAFIREAYPLSGAQAIWQRLEVMSADLQSLITALNRDGLTCDGRRAQETLCALEELRQKASWPDCATWPPIVTADAAGDTHWNCET